VGDALLEEIVVVPEVRDLTEQPLPELWGREDGGGYVPALHKPLGGGAHSEGWCGWEGGGGLTSRGGRDTEKVGGRWLSWGAAVGGQLGGQCFTMRRESGLAVVSFEGTVDGIIGGRKIVHNSSFLCL